MIVFKCTDSNAKCKGLVIITAEDNGKEINLQMCADNYDGCPCRKKSTLEELKDEHSS